MNIIYIISNNRVYYNNWDPDLDGYIYSDLYGHKKKGFDTLYNYISLRPAIVLGDIEI